MTNKVMESVLGKIVKARYDTYLFYWNIGDDEIKKHNEKCGPNDAKWATVSEAYHYYLKAWNMQYKLEK